MWFCLRHRLLWLGPRIVECDLYADFSSIFAFAGQLMPYVRLSSARDDGITEVNPCFSDQFRLLVVVENRHLQLVVVWRVVHVKPELLVPVQMSLLVKSERKERERGLAYHLGVCPPRMSVFVFLASLPSLAAQ